jgi:hypothetical protein
MRRVPSKKEVTVATNGPHIATGGLSRSEQLDLLECLPPGSAELRSVEAPPGELGEPVMAIALIALTTSALAGVCAWLANRGKDVELDLEVHAGSIGGAFSFKARSGDSAEDLVRRVEERGVEVAPE